MISYYIVLFFIYSFIGYIYEVLYYLITERTLKSPGFLFGPVCPIYGFGALTVTFLITYTNFFNVNDKYFNIKMFLFASIGSAILEYFVHLFLEKKFHAVWWDYSHFPFNLEGRISLFTSIGFGVAGIFIPKTAIPFIINHINYLPAIFFEIAALILISIFTFDLTITVVVLADFIKKITEINNEINTYMKKIGNGTVNKVKLGANKVVNIKNAMFENRFSKAFSKKDYLYKFIINNVQRFKFKENSSIIKNKVKGFFKK